ncbi:MAG: cyclic nucleotide-binding domain-containing protein [Pseudomonadota bacterium]
MRAAEKIIENKKRLHDLVPLNALTEERFAELSEKIVIETVKAGQYLFRKGDRDNQTFYLLEGSVSLVDGARKVVTEIHAGTEQSLNPISNLQPRQFSARTVSRSVVARIDTGLLDVFLSWDPSSMTEVVEIGSVESNDWMTRMLQQSKAFVKLPPSLLQLLLMKFKQIEVCKDDVIIAQGSEGEHFYTIHEGRCVVTRRREPGAPEEKLAELANGDSFGEEALVSACTRNASVTMLTDGILMCLAKQDFVDLLKTQLVKYVNYDEAVRLVNQGAVWLDVRTPEEYARSAFEDSVNIPLPLLRGEMPELVYNAKYVICCDSGSRSDSAAFVLSHRGFDVCVLSGGMTGQQAMQGDLAVADGRESEELSHESYAGAAAAVLQAEVERERELRRRVEQQLDLAREELAESGGKLADLYSRISMLEEGKRQSELHLVSLREKHAQQMQSISEELEQEKMQSHRLSKTVGRLRDECESLRKELCNEQEQSEVQFLQMRSQLDEALARVTAFESADVRAGAAMPDLLDAGASPAATDRLQIMLAREASENRRLREILLSVANEKQGVDMQMQAVTQSLEAMHDSMSRMAENLSHAGPGDGGGLE